VLISIHKAAPEHVQRYGLGLPKKFKILTLNARVEGPEHDEVDVLGKAQ
jgi:hypothetical protein